MKAYIKSVSNGYILTTEDDGQFVFSSDDNTEVETFAELLQTISMIYGPSTSRYSEQRIYIDIKPGDKFEDGKEDE